MLTSLQGRGYTIQYTTGLEPAHLVRHSQCCNSNHSMNTPQDFNNITEHVFCRFYFGEEHKSTQRFHMFDTECMITWPPIFVSVCVHRMSALCAGCIRYKMRIHGLARHSRIGSEASRRADSDFPSRRGFVKRINYCLS